MALNVNDTKFLEIEKMICKEELSCVSNHIRGLGLNLNNLKKAFVAS